MCSTIFIAALFVIASPSTEEQIRKMWCIYTMEYYIAEKNNDILNFAGEWIELENIILSEVTQTQKDNYHMYSTMFIAALFVIARTWKQPKCPTHRKTDKENVVHLHNGVLHSRKE